MLKMKFVPTTDMFNKVSYLADNHSDKRIFRNPRLKRPLCWTLDYVGVLYDYQYLREAKDQCRALNAFYREQEQPTPTNDLRCPVCLEPVQVNRHSRWLGFQRVHHKCVSGPAS